MALLKADRLWLKEFQGWGWGTQITGGVPGFITRASDLQATGTDFAEASSDGKSLCSDSSLVVHGREVGQGACYELLRLLVCLFMTPGSGHLPGPRADHREFKN